MFTFTWTDSNMIKNCIVIKDFANANNFYIILHDNAKVHNLRVLQKTENTEQYVIFVKNILIPVT